MEEKKIERMRKRERQIPSCIHSFVEEMMGGEPTLFLSFFFHCKKMKYMCIRILKFFFV
jgi:hypothetical protein